LTEGDRGETTTDCSRSGEAPSNFEVGDLRDKDDVTCGESVIEPFVAAATLRRRSRVDD
jgi:hypothetical protein